MAFKTTEKKNLEHNEFNNTTSKLISKPKFMNPPLGSYYPKYEVLDKNPKSFLIT